MLSFGQPFNILATVDSTNNYAMQKVHARMAKHGAAWFAKEQTLGKGQRGKSWLSNKGENIALSIVAEPHFLSPVNSFWLTAAVAVGVCDFVKTIAGDETKIKWPNDIYWGDRKAGGILIETLIRAEKWLFAVIGTGININQESFPPELHAVSLRQITGKRFDIVELARELCGFLEKSYGLLENEKQTVVLQQYNDHLYKKNEVVRFERAGESFSAVVNGVSGDGLLKVETDGAPQKLAWGSVRWIIDSL
ncbi:MAG: biotin--[acetyl-CoA-carboxylase] ligase [Chitinophagaceae bacterium]|nr:biotin--[acetyl-CoA-carboxylase] ligase [Chitinophagaceae bacterium]